MAWPASGWVLQRLTPAPSGRVPWYEVDVVPARQVIVLLAVGLVAAVVGFAGAAALETLATRPPRGGRAGRAARGGPAAARPSRDDPAGHIAGPRERRATRARGHRGAGDDGRRSGAGAHSGPAAHDDHGAATGPPGTDDDGGGPGARPRSTGHDAHASPDRAARLGPRDAARPALRGTHPAGRRAHRIRAGPPGPRDRVRRLRAGLGHPRRHRPPAGPLDDLSRPGRRLGAGGPPRHDRPGAARQRLVVLAPRAHRPTPCCCATRTACCSPTARDRASWSTRSPPPAAGAISTRTSRRPISRGHSPRWPSIAPRATATSSRGSTTTSPASPRRSAPGPPAWPRRGSRC